MLLGGRVGEVGLLGMARSKSATGTLLFDEIEKAHPRVLDLFLQILDAARVTMASGETLDLSGFYVVFTSNIAASEILNVAALVVHDNGAPCSCEGATNTCVLSFTHASRRSWSSIV